MRTWVRVAIAVPAVGFVVLAYLYLTLPDVRALKTSDVNDAAKSVIHPDNMIWVVVGDRAKIETGIKELNLGELRLMDADGKLL